MKITVIGSAGSKVTGSAHLIQTSQARVLVDCGLFQGGKKTVSKNRLPSKTRANLDAVLITNAHLDHTGHLPARWWIVERIMLQNEQKTRFKIVHGPLLWC